jgi:transcription elongation factor Elf1
MASSILEKYAHLKPQVNGRDHLTECPECNERKFSISTVKKIALCFSCGFTDKEFMEKTNG